MALWFKHDVRRVVPEIQATLQELNLDHAFCAFKICVPFGACTVCMGDFMDYAVVPVNIGDQADAVVHVAFRGTLQVAQGLMDVLNALAIVNTTLFHACGRSWSPLIPFLF